MRKARKIQQTLAEQQVPINKLREYCISHGGLVNDEIRRAVWPKLLGIHGDMDLHVPILKQCTCGT